MATIIQPSYRWSGPFEGYIKGTPKNENGKSGDFTSTMGLYKPG